MKRSILVSPLNLEQDMKEDPGQDVLPLPTVGQETTFRPVGHDAVLDGDGTCQDQARLTRWGWREEARA